MSSLSQRASAAQKSLCSLPLFKRCIGRLGARKAALITDTCSHHLLALPNAALQALVPPLAVFMRRHRERTLSNDAKGEHSGWYTDGGCCAQAQAAIGVMNGHVIVPEGPPLEVKLANADPATRSAQQTPSDNL